MQSHSRKLKTNNLKMDGDFSNPSTHRQQFSLICGCLGFKAFPTIHFSRIGTIPFFSQKFVRPHKLFRFAPRIICHFQPCSTWCHQVRTNRTTTSCTPPVSPKAVVVPSQLGVYPETLGKGVPSMVRVFIGLPCQKRGGDQCMHIYVRSGLNSHYFHIIGDKLINPIVGVYIPSIRIPGFPIEGWMTIPNARSLDPGSYDQGDFCIILPVVMHCLGWGIRDA